jgi:S1-C subfamily serine protease
MTFLRRSRTRALLLVAATVVVAGAGARLAFARDAAAPIGTGIVVIDTNLAYQDGAAAGTGMVLTSSGEVLTNNHVIAGATTIRVVLPDTARRYSAQVVGYDRAHDVAVLQLQKASNLKTVSTSASSRLSTGTRVMAVGNAGGSGSLTSASGTITGLGKRITASDDQGGSETLTGLIETNAGVQPGDSGGPLFDGSGHVIGMNTAASTRSGFQAVNASDAYAIPIGAALAIAQQIESGKATATVHIGATAFLGVEVESVNAARYGDFGSGTTSGALIAGVVSGGPADSAGLSAGDVIIAVGGRTISTPVVVTRVIMAKKPGQKVSVKYVDQDGVTHTTSVKLGSGPAQ